MNKKKTNTKQKKTAYVSLNFTELQLLKDKGSMEHPLMYLLLKKRANFRTGVVKGFNGHKLTYVELAQDMTRPPSQGKAGVIISPQQARGIVGRMAEIGLVSDVSFENGELTMKLPLSPIEYVQEVEINVPEVVIAKTATTSPKFKQGATPKQSNPHSGFPDMDDTPSVLSFSSTNSTKSLSNDSGEGTPSPAVASNVHPHPILEEANPEKSQSQKLTNSFAQLLKQSNFELTNGSLSREAYQRWADGGITIEQVASAIESVVAGVKKLRVGRLLPLDVDNVICAKAKKKSTGRGKVAL